VADCRIFQNVLAGPHPVDVTSLKPKLTISEGLGSIKGWKVAFSPKLGNYNVDPEVGVNARAAAEAFREAGATVEEVQLSWDVNRIREAARAHFGTIFGPLVAYYVNEHAEIMTDYAKYFAEWAANVPPGGYVQGLEVEGEMYAEFGAMMEEYDLFVCPTLGLVALEAGKSYVGSGPIVNGKQQNIIDHLMTIPFNILSRCPVMSVPSGFNSEGVPTGIQLVGRTYDDVSVFQAAAAFEQLRPWLDTPERRPKL
jgi:aspartyl-tRNA(Asn)/glutamyl-tRNA(Gln) amidotransferase subunit A